VNRSLSLVVTAVAGLALIACAPGASGSSGEPSNAASAVPQGAHTPGGDALPSFTAGAVADLEAWIPDSVAGVAIQKQSMVGGESLLEFDEATIGELLQDLGVSPSDVSLAIGIGYSATDNFSARIFVFRAAGVDTDPLAGAFKKATNSGRDTDLDWTSTMIGGKNVETAIDGNLTNYLYVKGDVLVFLVPSDAEIAAEIVGGLP